MAITKADTRQNVVSVLKRIDYTDIMDVASGATTTYDICDLPAGAVLTKASLVVSTAFTSTTATAATLSLGKAGALTAILGNTSVKAAGYTDATLSGTNSVYLTNTTVQATVIMTGDPADATAGDMFVEIEYVQNGRANEVQG